MPVGFTVGRIAESLQVAVGVVLVVDHQSGGVADASLPATGVIADGLAVAGVIPQGDGGGSGPPRAVLLVGAYVAGAGAQDPQ